MSCDVSSMSVRELLESRARLYSCIREFFASRQILEVETPIFSPYANTDPYISSLSADFASDPSTPDIRYAHTSPEFAMKRLLCAGSGSIYQLVKVFRKEEKGRLHNPEFSMLEWYCVAMNYRDLAREVIELLKLIGIEYDVVEYSYIGLFETFLNIDLEECGVVELQQVAAEHGLSDCGLGDDYNAWLHYLLTHLIEPKLANIPLVIIYDFPPSQAALAKISQEIPQVALRFEIYLHGIELANGYQELTDARQYRERFEKENQIRKNNNQPIMPMDEQLLKSLENQLPECSGVALGLDRLLMVATKSLSISDVIT